VLTVCLLVVSEGFFCSPRGPGSLECLNDGLSRLSEVMDGLTYQLELTDSFDSGNGSSNEDTAGATEADEDDEQGEPLPEFCLCHECDRVASQSVCQSLRRCARLLTSSRAAVRRLRRICCNLRRRHDRASDALGKRAHAAAQLEATVAHMKRESREERRALDDVRRELQRRTQEV